MKPTWLIVVALTVLPASLALAHEHEWKSCSADFTCCSAPAHWRARHDTRDARLAINTVGGEATLLITDDVVAVQLSDQTMKRVRHELDAKLDGDDENALAQSIKAVVISSVRALLNHSAECRIRDLNDVEIEDGRLVFLSRHNEHVFTNLDLNDDDVMSGFSERDAEAFVREFHRVKSSWQ